MKRVLIIGTGGIAHRHIGALANIHEIHIASVCDIHAERAKEFAAPLGAAVFTSIDEAMSQSQPDYVILTTPREVREEAIAKCISHGLPVFMEKPPCHNLSAGEKIREMLASSQLLHSVGFNTRWHDSLNVALGWLSGQRLSRIAICFSGTFAAQPIWKTYAAPYLVERSGGLVGDQGIHYIDIARYISKSEVKRVMAMGCNQILPKSEHVSTVDAAAWLMEMENGVLVSHNHTWGAPGWSCLIDMVADGGIVRVDICANTASGTVNGETVTHQGTQDEFENEHRGFLRAVEAGDISIVCSPYADALESFRVAANINKIIYGETPELL